LRLRSCPNSVAQTRQDTSPDVGRSGRRSINLQDRAIRAITLPNVASDGFHTSTLDGSDRSKGIGDPQLLVPETRGDR
jgi:hypothetical protein